jgi:hypothetical protein
LLKRIDGGDLFTENRGIPNTFMKTTLTILAGAISLCCLALAESENVADQTPAQLKQDIEKKHPAAYYMLAAKLFKDPATKREALFWFYVGQLRYRYHLAANPDLPPDGDPALFASFSEVIGRPINEYAGGVPDIWIAEMNHALEWDNAHDNGFTPKTKSPDKYRQIRAGLVSMREQISAMKDKLPEMRRKNGLNN